MSLNPKRRPETTLVAQLHPRPYLIHWERTLRWYTRSGEAVKHGKPQDDFDFLLTLFTSILQMRDWLTASQPELKAEVLALYRESPYLALVRDVANGAKHMTLMDYSVDGAATVAREYIGGGASHCVIPRPGGGNLDALQLAATAIDEIRSFMETTGLLPPSGNQRQYEHSGHLHTDVAQAAIRPLGRPASHTRR